MSKKLLGLGITTLLVSIAASAGTTPWHTFTTSSDGGTTYRVSTDGNVYSIESPTGYEHINVGDVFEGYALCYLTDTIQAYDYANSAGGFGTATHTSTSPFTVTRNTLDGKVQLKQVFTFNATSKSLNIVMTVKNLTGSSLSVDLTRIADFDVDVGGTNGFAQFGDNWFARTRDSVFAWNDAGDFLVPTHGLVLRHLKQSSGAFHVAKIPSFVNCDTDSGNPLSLAHGDYIGSVHYDFSLAGGASKSVTIQYMRD